MKNFYTKHQQGYCTLQRRTEANSQSQPLQTAITYSLIVFLTSIILIFSTTIASAQIPSPPTTPQPATFQQYNYNNTNKPTNYPPTLRTKPTNINDRQQTINRQQQIEEIEKEAKESFIPKKKRSVIDTEFDTTFGNPPVITKEKYEATKPYWDAMVTLADMANGSRQFSLTEAIFTVENAYFHDSLTNEVFYNSIKARVGLCKQIMQREKLNPDNNLAKNYAIQKLFEQNNSFINPKTGKTVTVPKLEYDFSDYMGDSSHTAMFVSKLLATGKGQCHSMPLLYLAIAEQLGAKANLSLAPQHSFIRFSDDDGSMYNYETTNGNIVSDNWMLQSGYITTAAIKNKIYLDTLSQKQLLALCMLDLAMGYQYDYGYDGFTEVALKYALPLDPEGIQANIMLSNFWTVKTKKAVEYFHIQTKEQFDQNSITYTLQRKMLQQYDVVDNLGYQEMPKEAYAIWLQSIDEEKHKQEEKELQKMMQLRLQKSNKNFKPGVIIIKKD